MSARDDLIEAMARMIKPLFVSAGLVDFDAEDYAYDSANAALPVAFAEFDRRVRARADDFKGDAEWTEGNFLPGPNSTGYAKACRELAASLREFADEMRAEFGGERP